jgi:hypothetical protein
MGHPELAWATRAGWVGNGVTGEVSEGFKVSTFQGFNNTCGPRKLGRRTDEGVCPYAGGGADLDGRGRPSLRGQWAVGSRIPTLTSQKNAPFGWGSRVSRRTDGGVCPYVGLLYSGPSWTPNRDQASR